jgi:hypothetical protein
LPFGSLAHVQRRQLVHQVAAHATVVLRAKSVRLLGDLFDVRHRALGGKR